MKISVVTVSFNSEKTIKDTLESVLQQSYENIEYIVVDGLSTDNTISIIKEYEASFKKTKKEFKWISEKDDGIYDAINKGIKLATGNVVGILNSDDYFSYDSVIVDIKEVFEQGKYDCLYGNLKYIDPDTNEITRNWRSKKFQDGLFEKSWTPAHPTFYCKKDIYDKFGLYRTDFKIAADVELMYRFLQMNHLSNFFLDRYLVTMRQGGVSSSGIKSTIIITKEMIKAFKDNGGKLNLVKYLFFKALKVKEFLVNNN